MIDFNKRKRIVWLASYPRSGNTWVRAFLFSLYHVFRDKPFDHLDFGQLNQFSVWDNSLILFRKHLRVPLPLVNRKDIAALRPRVFADLAASAKGVVLVKTHNARIDDLGTPFIDDSLTAGAIYLIRNPLDVAISFADFRRISVDQAIKDLATRKFGRGSDQLSVYWVCDSWTGNVRSWTDRPDPGTLVVRYEDMCDDPTKAFDEIARHLLMKPSAEQLAKALELTAFQNLKQSEQADNAAARRADVPQFFRVGQSRQWRDTLTPAQIDLIVADHGKLMERFGYLP